MNAERGPGHGRHRTGDETTAWVPRVRDTREHGLRHSASLQPRADDTPTEPEVIEPLPPDPLTATSPSGLAKFNLGTVPASVTPPRSWRKAAWFTVISSAAVLVALVFLTTSLFGPPTRVKRIDALPGYPSGLSSRQLDSPGPSPPTRDRQVWQSNTGGAERTTSQGPGHASGTGPSARRIDPASTRPPGATRGPTRGTAPTDRAGSSAGTPTSSVPKEFPPPETTTVSSAPGPAPYAPPSNPDGMTKQTKTYFAKVAKDPEVASKGTSGVSEADVRKRYGHARSVQVKKITADPNAGTTTNEIVVHGKNGSKHTETHTLSFTRGKNPKITADTAES